MPQPSDTHFSEIWLFGVKDSQDGSLISSLVGAFANSEYEQGLGALDHGVNQTMARLA
jgi:hypothetical protein